MKPTDLRIRIQRAPSLIEHPLPASPLAAHPPLAASGLTPSPVASPLDSTSAAGAPFENETPPSTPPCTGQFNLLPHGLLALGGRRQLLRRNSSLSSVSSSIAEDEEVDEEWTEEEKEKLKATFESYCDSVEYAPFSKAGAPPPNLPQLVARAVIRSEDTRVVRSSARARRDTDSSGEGLGEVEMDAPEAGQKWRHGLKSTRVKILALVKERQSALESTPTQGDPDATPKRRKALARQGSMDFLPSAPRNIGIVARLGSKLHRAEHSGPPPTSHPYSNATRLRVHRTASLSSIAGSPTQPSTKPELTTTTSARMSRVASDSTGHNGSSDYEYDLPSVSKSSSPGASSSLFDLTFGDSTSATTPKRPNGAERLGSAFHSPVLGAYPSPVSMKKAKFRHSPTPSVGLDLGSSFGSPFGGALGGEGSNPMASSSRGGRLGASANFYLAGQDHAMSNTSIASYDSDTSLSTTATTDYSSSQQSTSFFTYTRHHLRPSSSSLSSFSSVESTDTVGMACGTPSPLSSTFDLNELSLEELEEEHGKEGANDYRQAGVNAQELRNQLKVYGWASRQ